MSDYKTSINPLQLVVNENVVARAVFEAAPPISPTPTPTSSRIYAGGSPTQTPRPSPTQTPGTPQPSPQPSQTGTQPVQWRDCFTGNLMNGFPPPNYIESTYTGPGGGVCWESNQSLVFVPSIENLVFNYKRGSGQYPSPITIVVQNPSYGVSYEVQLNTDQRLFTITPSLFQVPPRESRTFTVSVKKSTLEEFKDGQTDTGLRLIITQI